MSQQDDYLWDRTGEVDPDVKKLEALLEPMAHDGRELDNLDASDPGGSAGHRRLWLWLVVAAGILLTVGLSAVWLLRRADVPRLWVAETGERLFADAEFRATEGRRELRLDDVGEFDFRPGSLVRVEQLHQARASLYLERGHMKAFVGVDAKPRFFQVGTPATRCIDLGCHYELDVAEDTGEAFVRVLMGRVAFQNGEREVFVPADAVCRASREHGAGTPYFAADAELLAEPIAAFDAASESPADERLALARKVMALAETIEQALPVWHFLEDRDERIALQALAALRRIDPTLTGIAGVRSRPDEETRVRWRKELFGYWW